MRGRSCAGSERRRRTTRPRELIALFVAGHSLTLLVATLAGWKLNATVADVVIALSLVWCRNPSHRYDATDRFWSLSPNSACANPAAGSTSDADTASTTAPT